MAKGDHPPPAASCTLTLPIDLTQNCEASTTQKLRKRPLVGPYSCVNFRTPQL